MSPTQKNLVRDERYKYTQGECLFERALGCSVCIQKWLFHCRRSKKLIHQKKWSFGNSRERTEAIWGSGFQFLYAFLGKVCSGLSQTKLSLRSSFTQLWCTTTYHAKFSKFLRLSFFFVCFPGLFSSPQTSPSACTAAPSHGEDSLRLCWVWGWWAELSLMGCSKIQHNCTQGMVLVVGRGFGNCSKVRWCWGIKLG